MMKKHILVVTSTFPSSELDPIPSFVKDQIDALKLQYSFLDFSVVAPHDAYSKTWLNEKSFTIKKKYSEYRFHYFWPFQFQKLVGRGIIPTLKQNIVLLFLIPFFILAEFFFLLKTTKNIKPDIIYAHWFTPQGITAGLVSSITGIPFVYTSHSSDVAILNKVPIFGSLIVKTFSRKAKVITVVSKRTSDKLESFFTDNEWLLIRNKVHIIPMGVNLVRSTESQTVTKDIPRNILFIGRLVEKKGVQYLLPAFARIMNNYPEIILTVAGEGPYMNKLKELTHALKIPPERINFTGYVQGKKKVEVFNKADIFVVPSIITKYGDAEGLPVSLMEGLATGKICIATYESGADEIITQNLNGILIPQKDVVSLANAIEKVITFSSNQQYKMKKEAQKTGEQFSWQSLSQQYFKLLFKD